MLFIMKLNLILSFLKFFLNKFKNYLKNLIIIN